MTDLLRQAAPEPEKVFTWWSYRAADWKTGNRGRRLDHIWASRDLAESARLQGRDAVSIHTACRDWDKPSDHVPVVARLRV
jgi:exodeoxyribonuclease-3